MEYFNVVVKDPDNMLRLVKALPDQLITESEVIWDSRLGEKEPDGLIAQAIQDDNARVEIASAPEKELVLKAAELSTADASTVKDLAELQDLVNKILDYIFKRA